MKQTLTLSYDTWTSLSPQQQAEQRAKYEVKVAQAYACLDQLREMARDGASSEGG